MPDNKSFLYNYFWNLCISLHDDNLSDEDLERYTKNMIEIAYSSASDILAYKENGSELIFNIKKRENAKEKSVSVPKKAFNKLIKDLPNIIASALRNYQLFIAGRRFYVDDDEGLTYSMDLHDSHLIGLVKSEHINDEESELTKKLLTFFQQNYKKVTTELSATNEELKLLLRNGEIYKKDNTSDIFQLHLLFFIMYNSYKRDGAIIDAINRINDIFSGLSASIRTTRNYNKELLLCWLFKKQYPNEDIANLQSSQLAKIFDRLIKENLSLLGIEYSDLLTDNERSKKENTFAKVENLLKSNVSTRRFDLIFDLQEKLERFYEYLICEVIKSEQSLESFDLLLVYGLFLKESIQSLVSINQTLVNPLKILDKCIYLKNYNYTTDISDIYLLNLPSKEKGNSDVILCNMTTFDNNLLAGLSRGIPQDESKSLEYHFFSIQNNTRFPEYEGIMLGFSNGNNIIFNDNLEIVRALNNGILKPDVFISELTKNKIGLRYATKRHASENIVSPQEIKYKHEITYADRLYIDLASLDKLLRFFESCSIEQFCQLFFIKPDVLKDSSLFTTIRKLITKSLKLEKLSKVWRQKKIEISIKVSENYMKKADKNVKKLISNLEQENQIDIKTGLLHLNADYYRKTGYQNMKLTKNYYNSLDKTLPNDITRIINDYFDYLGTILYEYYSYNSNKNLIRQAFEDLGGLYYYGKALEDTSKYFSWDMLYNSLPDTIHHFINDVADKEGISADDNEYVKYTKDELANKEVKKTL